VRGWFWVGLASLFLNAQAPPPPLVLPRLTKAPVINRASSLAGWEGALRVTEFGPWYPEDKGKPVVDTVAYLAWGPDGLYVAVEAHNPQPATIRAFPGRRDNLSGNQDTVTLDLDATGKGQAAVSLSCNALGVQSDALVTPNSWSDSYDLLWTSAGVRTVYGYLVKFRIPFTSLRRVPGAWGLRISRYHPGGRGYRVAWPQQNQNNSCDLCQLAKITGAPDTNGGAPFLVIPTFTAHRAESVAEGTMGRAEQAFRPGLDLRYSGQALTLDGTYRPDFSAVEADIDPLIINSRFKYQFPEKRPFFQEGLEIFNVRGAQQQIASRSILDPEYGIKATGRTSWGSWGTLLAQDKAGGASLASDGALVPDGLKTRDLALAAHVDTDAKGSSLTFMGTDALLLGGAGSAFARSAGAYLDQRFGEHVKVALNRVESSSLLPTGDPQPARAQGSATRWGVDWGNRIWWAGAGGSATSPDLVLANGFVDLTGYKTQWGGVGANLRSAEKWWSYVGGGLNLGRSDWWNGDPMSRDISAYASLSTRNQLRFFTSFSPHSREWVLGQWVDTNFVYLNSSFNRFAWLRPSVSQSFARTPDYATGLPARSGSRNVNLNGNVGATSYSVQWGLNQLRDVDSAALLRRAQRLYAKLEYAFPLSLYLHLQAQSTRYEAAGAEITHSRFLQVLTGWQPNAFTQVYLGYSQKRGTDLDLSPVAERLLEKGLFAKAAYAVHF